MNKAKLIKAIKNNFDINKIYLEVDIRKEYLFISIKSVSPYQTIFLCSLGYSNLKEKKEAYKELIKCINYFDFSFTLEFNTIEELKKWNSLK